MEIIENITINGVDIGLTDEQCSSLPLKLEKNGVVHYGNMTKNKPDFVTLIAEKNGEKLYLNNPVLQSAEFKILYFGLARGDNSGGTFNMNEYLFRNSPYVVCTKVKLINASHYERSFTLNGIDYSGVGEHILQTPLLLKDNVSLVVPGSADYWYAEFYGYIINPDYLGQDVEMITKNYTNLTLQN